MAKEAPSTSVHQGPAQPAAARRRPALVCAYPRPLALPLPESGTVVGRGWLAERGLLDSEVSSSHLRFERAGGALRVVDAGSRNGTWVNGAALAPGEKVLLDEGAVVRLGRTLFVLRERLEGPLDPAPPVGELVGPFGLRAVARELTALAEARPRNVLIEGETGAGKELVARALAASVRGDAPFVAVNVAGIAPSLFESHVFGHVAGAFSGAGSASPGILAAHDGGTVFLDEIGELSLELQAKLLRFLDNREVMPVGASASRRVDVLVLAATHRDLHAMVEEGRFRRDLLARLALARVRIPPLRERSEDLFSVAVELSRRAGARFEASEVEVEAMERLLLEPWPSNVRELDAVLAAVRRSDPEPGLRLWALEEAIGRAPAARRALTREMIEEAVRAAGGNVTAAAKNLGVSRGRLLRLRKSS